MLKLDPQDAATYQEILAAVLKCATNCFFKGRTHEYVAATAIEEEYLECSRKIYKALTKEE
jgi:hypothetical protein